MGSGIGPRVACYKLAPMMVEMPEVSADVKGWVGRLPVTWLAVFDRSGWLLHSWRDGALSVDRGYVIARCSSYRGCLRTESDVDNRNLYRMQK